MADHTVAAAEIGVWEQTLGAGADTVTFDRDCEEVRVTNVDGVAAIYFTLDNSTPTPGAKSTYWIPAVAGASRTEVVRTSGDTVVKIDSSGTPKYSCEGSL